ncbi:transcription initiation protein [Flavobacteriaceae bacterium TP-CH-4]|uniref:Transcription initiation protein n=1 Tax=Pelagihabitans pacificus TaxID=2696054 RepID=A0A967E6C6_9FLAO|nr:YciI family protein [Pelagihabitans pacificus]NHF59475.1 transcription initiation protein [Pelagihabitans pacificus]
MKEFMMLFRTERNDAPPPSPEQMQAMVKTWQDWIGGIAAQGKFVSTDALGYQGKTVHADGLVTDGPYAEIKEIVGGYIVVKAENLEEAVKLSEGCPTLSIPGGKVEVRDVMVFDM